MEDFIKAAIEQGFTHYGFSPHAPVPIESPCNMAQDDVEAYLSEVSRLKAVFGSRILLFASMEIDYLGEHWGPANEYFVNLPLDYRIGSVHFLPSFASPEVMVDVDGKPDAFCDKMDIHFGGDIEAVVRQFFAHMTEMVTHGGFDIVGHCDKIALNASHFRSGIDSEPWFEKLVINLIDAIMDCHLAIEINTKSWQRHHRFFPNERYFPLLARYGATICVNSDAHEPALINAGRVEAINRLLGTPHARRLNYWQPTSHRPELS